MASSIPHANTLVEDLLLVDKQSIYPDLDGILPDEVPRVYTTFHAVSLVHTLPNDLLGNITDFLPHRDLLRLSHAGVPLFNGLLRHDSDFWNHPLHPEDPPYRETPHSHSAKRRYFRTRFYHFADDVQHDGRSAITLPRLIHHLCGHVSFTIGLRFAMELPAAEEANALMGGTLLGAQMHYSPAAPKYPRNMINIDANGNLSCSILDARPIIARNLQPEQWYHLVLTFDPLPNPDPPNPDPCVARQCVYLDGQLLDTSTGTRFYPFYMATHWQLGSGPEMPTAGRIGFRGRIHDFSLRRRVLSPEGIQFLSENGEPEDSLPDDKVAWSLRSKPSEATFHGQVVRVKHSRG